MEGIDISQFPTVRTSTDPATNTLIDYQYRDASNYKLSGSVIFAGPPTAELVKRLLITMPARGSAIGDFVPAQIGMPDFCEEMPGEYDGDTGWHELLGIEATKRPADDPRSFAELVAGCEAVLDWDDHPRVPYEETIWAVPGYGEGRATDWMLGPRAIWTAVAIPVETYADIEGLDAAHVKVLPIARFPELGALHYGIQSLAGAVITRTEPTPGSLFISADEVRIATGHAPNDAEMELLRQAILAGLDNLIWRITPHDAG